MVLLGQFQFAKFLLLNKGKHRRPPLLISQLGGTRHNVVPAWLSVPCPGPVLLQTRAQESQCAHYLIDNAKFIGQRDVALCCSMGRAAPFNYSHCSEGGSIAGWRELVSADKDTSDPGSIYLITGEGRWKAQGAVQERQAVVQLIQQSIMCLQEIILKSHANICFFHVEEKMMVNWLYKLIWVALIFTGIVFAYKFTPPSRW